jgi:hypothetical protein
VLYIVSSLIPLFIAPRSRGIRKLRPRCNVSED